MDTQEAILGTKLQSTQDNTVSIIPTKNRFEALQDLQSDTSMDTEPIALRKEIPHSNFLNILKRKNNQQDCEIYEMEDTKKTRQTPRNMKPPDTHNSEENNKNDTNRESTIKLQKTKRKERPPPINIMFQDPKDTGRLIKEV